jgi:hypothetical protein
MDIYRKGRMQARYGNTNAMLAYWYDKEVKAVKRSNKKELRKQKKMIRRKWGFFFGPRGKYMLNRISQRVVY